MKSLVIKGNLREAVGKKDAKKLRYEGNVPCVLYGENEPIHFYAPFNEFRKIVYTPNVYLLEIDIEGKVYQAIMQDIQWHPIDEQILHVDFLQIRDDKPVKIEVPVVTQGMAIGIKAGGKLKVNMRRLRVKAFSKDLPDNIEIDVTELAVGQSVKVGDLAVNNLEFLDNPSNVVVSVIVTRAAKAAADAEEDDEAPEGTEEEAPAAESEE